MSTPAVMEIKPPYTPELLPEVQAYLSGFLRGRSAPTVLELGSGWSTVWFALNGASVHSVEHDHDWYLSVGDALHEAQVSSFVHRVLRPPDLFPSEVLYSPDGAYDLILVDCVDEQRIPCLTMAKHKLKPNGLMVVDDIHWDLLHPAYELLNGWPHVLYSGNHTRKTGEVCYHSTAIFSKR